MVLNRRRRIAAFALVATLAVFGISYGALPSKALAWNNCPYGLVNDPYPGECRRYTDTNGDDICDLSQSEPVASTTTTAAPPSTTTTTQKPTTTTTSLAVATTTSGEPPTGDCPLGPCAGCGACLSIGSVVSLASADNTDTESAAIASGAVALAATGGSATTSTTIPPSGGSSDGSAGTTVSATGGGNTDQASFFTGYNVSPIALGFFLIYAVSFILYKTKKIRVTTHRKIWNVLLLATFLITGIFGLILTIQLDYTLPFTIPFDLLFWHVEAGVAMTLISLFHVGWHFNYYRNLLRRNRRKVRVARAAEQAQPIDDRQLVWQAREQRRTEREARRGQKSHPDPAPSPVQAASRRTQTPRPYLPPHGRLEPEAE